MAIGVNQRVLHWANETITESESRVYTENVEKASELIVWIENDSTSQDEMSWLLETQISGSDIWVELDTVALASNQFDPGDAWALQYVMAAPITTSLPASTRILRWDASAVGSEMTLSLEHQWPLMETIKLTVTADTAAGNYLIDAWLLFRG